MTDFIDSVYPQHLLEVSTDHNPEQVARLNSIFGEALESGEAEFAGAYLGQYDEYDHNLRALRNNTRGDDVVVVLVMRFPAWNGEAVKEVSDIAETVAAEAKERKRLADVAATEAKLAEIDDERAELRVRLAELRGE